MTKNRVVCYAMLCTPNQNLQVSLLTYLSSYLAMATAFWCVHACVWEALRLLVCLVNGLL